MTKVDRVGPMIKGKTPPVGEDKQRFCKRGLKGRLLFFIAKLRRFAFKFFSGFLVSAWAVFPAKMSQNH